MAAGTLNAMALTTFGAAFILTSINGGAAPLPVIWIPAVAVLHFRGACNLSVHAARGSTMTSMWVTYGLPVAALIFGAAIFLYVRYEARKFDARFGSRHLHPGE